MENGNRVLTRVIKEYVHLKKYMIKVIDSMQSVEILRIINYHEIDVKK